ncbi:hypothetical protein NDU88_004123 [Pleurodeles waltl]|uniref:Uncharacterized protein n=1 Tax=Pleurodeles waltl TaxID=8319 RepID=A0AAV7M8Z9_PLEWA|nr:hypothetical protein NDU88_004123 [Pleurodeles waltl]
MTHVSLGDSEMVQRTLVPDTTKKYRRWVTNNGQRVEALRDTGASVPTVRSHLVSEDLRDPRVLHQVDALDNSEHLCRLAHVPFEWGGLRFLEDSYLTSPQELGKKADKWVRTMVSRKAHTGGDKDSKKKDGNDLETLPWAEVELEARPALLGIPGHILALTRAQAKKQRGQGNLDPGIMDAPKTRGEKGKSLSTIPSSTNDSPFEEEEFSPCAEPTPEELEADTAELLGAGGPAREELSVA